MSTSYPPIQPEFSDVEDATAYDIWFREQVQAALDDPRPSIPHDQVMAAMRALIALKRRSG